MASHQLQLALGTHRGKLRASNEDAVAYHYPSDLETLNNFGALFVIADGVGGLANGAEAAQTAVKRLIEIYYHEPLSNPMEMLRTSMIQVNTEIYREHHTKAATTIVALLIRQDEAIVAHVGDSRAYHGRPNMLKLITQDHAAEVIESDGQARRKLTRALGYRAYVEATVNTHSVQKDDCFLLVTDGATRYFDTNGLYKLLSEEPRESVQRIIERSNEAGGMDNTSAIMVMVGAKLANENALSTHLRQLAHIGVTVDIEDDTDAPKNNHVQPFFLWLILTMGFILGLPLLLLAKDTGQSNTELDLEGRSIRIESPIITYAEADSTISAFLTDMNTTYRVQDMITHDEIWICLYDSENERMGWLRLADLPAYTLLD